MPPESRSPADESGCRWIGVQAQPGRLDLIANLIRLDGTWQSQPASLLRRLSDEARRIENELHLTPVRTAPERQAVARPVPTASTQLATVLAQLADEQSGPLATVRGLIEHTAHRLARQPGAGSPGTAHRLELIAHRLLGIQQDLDASAAHLAARPTGAVPRHGIATAPPEVRHTRRSP